MNRRKYLVTAAALGVGGIAGCSGDGDDDGGTPTGGNGDGGTDADGGDGDTPTDGDGGGGTPTGDGGDGGTTTGGDGTAEPVSYGDLFAFEQNYAVDVEFSGGESGESGTATIRYHDGDYYQRVEFDSTSRVFEMYHVGEDDYVVIDEEQCLRNPGSGAGPDADLSSQSDAEDLGNRPPSDLEPTGTAEIDGETVYVFEPSGADTADITLYVSAATGYLRRVEGPWGTADYHSWGETEPVSEPDLDCREPDDQ